MKGVNHERFNTLTMTSISFYIVSLGLPCVDVIMFWLHGMFHTYLLPPDVDTKSRASRRLGFLGKIFYTVFTHRKILHNPVFWTMIYIVAYVRFETWWIAGGVLAIYLHIWTDALSTKVKRLNPF